MQEVIMRISVVMPAYNEEANIEKTVISCFEELARHTTDSEVVVTNDGSKDSTPVILTALSAKYPSLKIETNTPNQGYGAALIKAIHASTGDIVVSIDSDGQFLITDLAELLPFLDESTDIVAGYRRQKKDSFARVYADRIMNLLIKIMFGVPFKDTNCALKIYKGTIIRNMPLEATGFQIPTEVVLKANALGYKIKEAPVNHCPRSGGKSGLAPVVTAIRMFVFLIYLKLKLVLFKKRIIRGL
jgi:glycosyltransferase involved in cell wall biosynthesis